VEHIPVLAGSAIEYLRIRGDGFYVDCTAGAGGHSALIAERLSEGGRLIAIDRDPEAVARVRERLKPYPRSLVVRGNYGDLAAVLAAQGVSEVDGVLIDAGISSMQLDDPARGFSFQEAGPLDMRMDPDSGLSAAEYLERVEESELARILREYGDLRLAKRIARAICRRRDEQPLRTTSDLVDTVSQVFDFVRGIPEETRTVFQAVRIAVNEELRELEEGLEQAIVSLRSGGRLVCITFHSGEDRIAKNVFRAASTKRRVLHADGRVKEILPAIAKVLTRKPVLPSKEEIGLNSRARSAKLRAIEKLA